MAEVNLETTDYERFTDALNEAATRAVEAKFKRRNDVPVFDMDASDGTYAGELDQQLVEMINAEIRPGCGLGSLMCIIDRNGELDKDTDHEWFINTASVLNDAGLNWLFKECVANT